MINCAEIRNEYNRLYTEVRRYIWSFHAVEALADLEIACYETCLNMENVRKAFYRFRQYAMEAMYADIDLSKAFNRFEKLMNSDDTSFAKLTKVEEVLTK